jgi:hypothetical protein
VEGERDAWVFEGGEPQVGQLDADGRLVGRSEEEGMAGEERQWRGRMRVLRGVIQRRVLWSGDAC